jgi:NAD(P)-dependent dehydrogenase (short-subunit alcohol dehydrogenase family)
MTNDRFEGKAVLVTGGGSGIGRAAAQRMASEGARVRIGDVDEAGLATTAAEHPRISTARCDVSDEASVKDFVAAAAVDLGGIDVVVNMAGILIFENSHELSLHDWQRIIDVNLTGTFLVCREALPHLVTSKGVIVNAASTAAHIGQPWSAAYCASKGAILSMTRALAVEYGRKGVRVNSVSPGAIETPIMEAFHFPEGADQSLLARTMPLGAAGQPADAAAAIAYLASDEAHYLNGSDLRVDGATTA